MEEDIIAIISVIKLVSEGSSFCSSSKPSRRDHSRRIIVITSAGLFSGCIWDGRIPRRDA